MKVTHSWGNKAKHNDKFILKLRIGKLTVIDIIIDISSKLYQFTLLNFTYRK
jgi:hypothetical protein